VMNAFRNPPSLAWSPDGRSLLTTDCENKDGTPSLTLISVETGQKVQLTHAPPRTDDDDSAFSPDGKLVAFRRSLGDSSDEIYVVPATGGAPRRLTFQSNPIDGLAWSPDGNSVIFSSGRATSVGSIWRVGLNGTPPVALTTPLSHTSSPTVSAAAHRMAYIDSPNNVAIWRLPLGKHEGAEQFIASNFFDSSASYSPDGTHLAFRSDRSGANEIWVSKSDGTEPKRTTHFDGPMTGSPRWSPDSKSVAFDSRVTGRADIYVVNSASGEPVRITNGILNNSDNVVPSWSHDGRSIYFSSNRTGQWQVWRHSLQNGSETQITTLGGFNGVESEDGSSLYYVRDMDATSLRRMSLQDGTDELILRSLGPGMWHSWTVSNHQLFYLQRESFWDPADFFCLDLASGATAPLGKVEHLVNDGIAVSPGGRWVLFAQRDNTRSSIMVLDGWQ
jgi:Tol biopolymer transport system component